MAANNRAIDGYIEDIREAVYGEEVRGSIIGAIEQCYTDAVDVVKVSDDPPGSENTKIWIRPTHDEYQVPTWTEHQELEDRVEELEGAVSDGDGNVISSAELKSALKLTRQSIDISGYAFTAKRNIQSNGRAVYLDGWSATLDFINSGSSRITIQNRSSNRMYVAFYSAPNESSFIGRIEYSTNTVVNYERADGNPFFFRITVNNENFTDNSDLVFVRIGSCAYLNEKMDEEISDVDNFVRDIIDNDYSISISGYSFINSKSINDHGVFTLTDGWSAIQDFISSKKYKKIKIKNDTAYRGYVAFYSGPDESDFIERVEITSKTQISYSYTIPFYFRISINATNFVNSGLSAYAPYALFDTISNVDLIKNTKQINLFTSEYFVGRYLINQNGSLRSSSSWEAYKIATDFYSADINVYGHNDNLWEIAFYSDEPAQSTFISGLQNKTSGSLVSFHIDRDDIPNNARYMLISNRFAYGGSANASAVTYINYDINKLDAIYPKLLKNSSYLSGKENVRAIYKNIQNTNDFVIIKDEIWFAKNIYSQGEPTDETYIRRCKISEDGTLNILTTLHTDFGHWNSVDYCERNDCLIFGNGANSTSTEGNFFVVVPNPLALPYETTISQYGIKYDVDVGYKVQAVWGDDNFGEFNIVYLLSNDAGTITKIMLNKDQNGDFDGTYTTLETRTQENTFVVNGCDYWGDTLYIGVGDGYKIAMMSLYDLSIKYIEKKMYKTDGTLYSGGTQGVAIDSDYIWVFSNISGSEDNYLVQYCR